MDKKDTMHRILRFSDEGTRETYTLLCEKDYLDELFKMLANWDEEIEFYPNTGSNYSWENGTELLNLLSIVEVPENVPIGFLNDVLGECPFLDELLYYLDDME